MKYIYPDNLKSKPKIFLWCLRDISIIGICTVVSVFFLAQTGTLLPLVITAVYTFLAIQFEGMSILDFIRYAVLFLIAKQQSYDWRA